MAQNAIIDGTNIDTSVFSYSAPKANPSGGKVVNIYNKNFKESITIATPLILTWGAQEGMDQAKNPTGKFAMSLQFPSAEYSNPDAEAFLNSMRALETQIKKDAIVNSKEWFGKTITSDDVMEEKFNVMLRHPKKEKGSAELNYDKPPTLTVKLPCWKGVWQSEIYDEEGAPLFLKSSSASNISPLDFLKPKTHVICLIQFGGLWFVNGKVSITWNLKQAVVQKPRMSSIVEGTCFIKPKVEDIAKLKAAPPPEEDVDPDGAVSSNIVDDSDDDDDRELPPPITVPALVLPVEKDAAVEPTTESSAEQSTLEPKKKRIISKKKVVA